MNKIFTLLVVSLLVTTYVIPQSRPYMIVKESEYDSLKAKSNTYPWSAFKENAITAAKDLVYDESHGHVKQCHVATDLSSALALCYILFPEKRQTYVDKFESDVYKLIDAIRNRKETTDQAAEHGFNVGPSQASFMVFLALDIMHSDIGPSKRAEIEDDLKYISLNHHSSWHESKYAIEGMYALYNFGPQSNEFIDKKDKYKNYLLAAASNDGVYTTGPGYAHSRLYTASRVQKKIFMDICEYQGYNEFYSNPVFINLYEWLFGYSVTPFNITYTFGDSPPIKPLYEWTTSALRVDRFSDKAQAYAAWYIGPWNDFSEKNTLLNYLFTEGVPIQAEQPKSRIFNNGGAWLLGDDPSPDNLAGVLWNVNPKEQSHNHLDVNAINIAAFGDNIIRNSGYDGWGEPNPELWSWISRDARSSNTLTVGGYNHQMSKGGGIKESITGYDIEFASANSGRSIVFSQHDRSLLFVKPVGNLPGYFYVFDEVSTLYESKEVNIYFHPNSNLNPVIENENMQYKFKIKPCTNLVDSLFLTIHFVDKPLNVKIRDGHRGSYDECGSYTGKYIDAGFSTAPLKSMDAATILFPHRNDNPVPKITSIDNTNFSLTGLEFEDDVIDYFINSKTDEEIEVENLQINSKALYLRKIGKNNLNVWCYKGNKFLNNANKSIGFESDSDITFLLNGKKGEVVTKGGALSIYYPGITKINIDGISFQAEGGNERVDISLEEGNHKFEIISDVELEEKELAEEGYYLSNGYPSYYNPTARISYKIPETQHVKIVVYDSSGKEIDVLLDEKVEAGAHSVFFNTDKLVSGVYNYKMITKEKILKKEMVLVR